MMNIEINIHPGPSAKTNHRFWNLLANLVNLPFAVVETLSSALFGSIWCITIFWGIPFGMQCFKMAQSSLWSFGKTIVTKKETTSSLFFNILWILITGFQTALIYLFEGVILCITLVAIPWGLQKFKLDKLVLLPFGAEIK